MIVSLLFSSLEKKLILRFGFGKIKVCLEMPTTYLILGKLVIIVINFGNADPMLKISFLTLQKYETSGFALLFLML